MAKNIKAGHEQIRAAQKGGPGASPCAREWDVATPLAIKLLGALIAVEAAIATSSELLAALPKVLTYVLGTCDLFMQWGVAADELILCLKRSNAPEPEIVRFRAMRRQADALTMQLNREVAQLRRRR